MLVSGSEFFPVSLFGSSFVSLLGVCFSRFDVFFYRLVSLGLALSTSSSVGSVTLSNGGLSIVCLVSGSATTAVTSCIVFAL